MTGSMRRSALTKRSQDAALMPPPTQISKRQKRPSKVLDEDVYSEAISHIIARDFYPGLLESEAQNEYMQALDSHDKQWIREAGRKLTQVMTPIPDGQRRQGRGTGFTPRSSVTMEETPRTAIGSTPRQTPYTITGRNEDFTPEDNNEVDVNMSLEAFQAKYTSEDNESFNALLDKQNAKRAAKYNFFRFGNQIPSARQTAYREKELRLLESGKRSSAVLVLTSADKEERTAVEPMRPSQDINLRSASVDSFPNRQGPNNSLMFAPDGVEDALTTNAQACEQRSNAPPKSIKYTSTRFSGNSQSSEVTVPPSPSMSAVDAALLGRPKATDSESGYAGAETPRVNGYAFVDAEPTPSELGIPVTDEEADTAEHEATYKLLPRIEDGGPNPFRLTERSKREDLHMRLVEKADAGRRKGTRLRQLKAVGLTSSPGRTPTPRFASAPTPSRKDAHMTPAARQLAARIGTPRKVGDGFGVISDRKSVDRTSAVTMKRSI
nr:protein dgcr14 like [Quercus suber]